MATASVQGGTASRAVSAAARVPVSFFSIVMGLTALGAAWRAASRAYGVSAWMADLRQTYKRRHAFGEELRRALESLGVSA